MNKFTVLVFFVCLFGHYFSASGQKRRNEFFVSATLTGFNDHTKFYLVDLDSTQRIDSAYLSNNKVTFKGKIDQPSVFRLYPELEDLYFNLWIEPRTINLAGSKDKFSRITVKGSPINDVYDSVQGKHYALDQLRDSLTTKAVNEPDESKAIAIWKNIAVVDSKVKSIRVQTIATFQPSIVTIKELYFLRNDFTRDSLKMLFSRFPSALQNTKYGNIINEYITTDDLRKGSNFIDIVGKDFNNKEIKLSQYKNKVIILDFWASWCGPCRSSNKYLAELHQKYNKEGFEIVSFSLDTNVESWRTASQKDSVTWVNISDLKGLYSKQAASYKIRAIPRSYLIDREGRITEVFTGYDKAHKERLSSQIEELLRK